MSKGGWVYMTANRYRGTIYTGVTSDLARRSFEHRKGTGSRFAKTYGAVHLVYAEPHTRIDEAIAREKAIKKWNREWKIRLIESANPDWLDLYERLNG